MLDKKTHLIDLSAKPVERSRKRIRLNTMHSPKRLFIGGMLRLRTVHMMLRAKRQHPPIIGLLPFPAKACSLKGIRITQMRNMNRHPPATGDRTG